MYTTRISQMNLLNIIPPEVLTEIGKYLNNRSLYNLLSSSKHNFITQRLEVKNRYQSLLDKYNRDEMIKKYCQEEHTSWYIEIFRRIKNEKECVDEIVNDLYNIIKLIQAGYKGYQKDIMNNDIIFILMPWAYNSKLLYFLKKMLKCGILHANVTNMSGSYPIGHAVAYNNYEAVKILVEHGNALEPITNSKLDLLISFSKKNDYIYTYLIRHKMKRIEKMNSDNEEEYIYSSSDDEFDDNMVFYESCSDSDSDSCSDSCSDSDDEQKPSPEISKKTGLNLENIPNKYDDQFNDLLLHSLKADKTRKNPPYSRDQIKDFLISLKNTENRHIIEDAYIRFKENIDVWATGGGYPEDPVLFISTATDGYNQKQQRSREIIERSLGKYYKKCQKRKQEEERRIKPVCIDERRKLFAKRFG